MYNVVLCVEGTVVGQLLEVALHTAGVGRVAATVAGIMAAWLVRHCLRRYTLCCCVRLRLTGLVVRVTLVVHV